MFVLEFKSNISLHFCIIKQTEIKVKPDEEDCNDRVLGNKNHGNGNVGCWLLWSPTFFMFLNEKRNEINLTSVFFHNNPSGRRSIVGWSPPPEGSNEFPAQLNYRNSHYFFEHRQNLVTINPYINTRRI